MVRHKYRGIWMACISWARIQSAQIDWPGTDFFLITHGMPLPQLLADLCANYNTPVIVSSQVTERFVGTLMDKTAKEILDEISALYNLIWYFDGKVLHVYKSNEVKTIVITPVNVTPEQLLDYLEKSDILDERSSIKRIEGFNAFEVFGVPACLDRIQSVVHELDSHAASAEHNQEVVEVIPLKYACVEDMEYEYRDQSVRIPGIISLLRSLHGSVGLSGENSEVESEPSNVTFSADTRSNAVIMKATESQAQLQRSLIQQLDQKPVQVEISVTIMDVDLMQASALGVETALGLKDPWKVGSAQINPETAVSTTGSGNVGTTSDQNDSFGCLGTFSTTIQDLVNFQMRLKALQREAKATVLAQPSVVTLNNMPAILDKSVTFYTKLVGKAESKIESITTGTLLRVTPRVIPVEGGAEQEILLQIDLQDGRHDASTNETGDAIPQVQKSEIITQAQLKTGEALLLGGFVREKYNNDEKGVPLLSRIPLLNYLFTQHTTETQRVVRLFLIRATPITLDLSSPLSESTMVQTALTAAHACAPDLVQFSTINRPLSQKTPQMDPSQLGDNWHTDALAEGSNNHESQRMVDGVASEDTQKWIDGSQDDDREDDTDIENDFDEDEMLDADENDEAFGEEADADEALEEEDDFEESLADDASNPSK